MVQHVQSTISISPILQDTTENGSTPKRNKKYHIQSLYILVVLGIHRPRHFHIGTNGIVLILTFRLMPNITPPEVANVPI
jgi:hypothetical protein